MLDMKNIKNKEITLPICWAIEKSDFSKNNPKNFGN